MYHRTINCASYIYMYYILYIIYWMLHMYGCMNACMQKSVHIHFVLQRLQINMYIK